MSEVIPQGVWSLKEALLKQEELQNARKSKRKRTKVIEIQDDASDTSDKVRRARKPRVVNGGGAVSTISLEAAPVTTEDSPSLPRKRATKTRKAPTHRQNRTQSSTAVSESDSSPPRTLPRETRPQRKSPRIRSRAIVLESDSEPELIPLPRKATARSRPPVSYQDHSFSDQSPVSPPKRARGNVPDNIRTTKVIKTSRATSKKAPKPTPVKTPKPTPAKTPKATPVKNPAIKISKPIEVIDVPSSRPGKRKMNVTSKVVKIKTQPAYKKGPTKAGSTPPLQIGTEVANSTQKTKYILEKILGSGGFGYIYVVTDCITKKKAVMKIEPQDNGPLFSEQHFYQRAGKEEIISSWCKKERLKYLGIPNMLGFGIYTEGKVKFRYLVMPQYDGDVLKIHEKYDKKFHIHTVILLCIRMLEALHYIHDAGYVHADVKGANILTKNKDLEVYLADFGLARKYTTDDKHRPYREEPGKAHDGTKEFTSIDAHKGVQPSRRGDLQILGYCCIDWLGGKLPWYEWTNGNKIRDEKIKHQHDMTELLEECVGMVNLTSKPWLALKKYLKISFSLKYDETPKYKDLLGVLKDGLSSKVADKGYMTWS